MAAGGASGSISGVMRMAPPPSAETRKGPALRIHVTGWVCATTTGGRFDAWADERIMPPPPPPLLKVPLPAPPPPTPTGDMGEFGQVSNDSAGEGEQGESGASACGEGGGARFLACATRVGEATLAGELELNGEKIAAEEVAMGAEKSARRTEFPQPKQGNERVMKWGELS